MVTTDKTKRFGILGYFGGWSMILLMLVGLIFGLVGYLLVAKTYRGAMKDILDDLTDSVKAEIVTELRSPVRIFFKTVSLGPFPEYSTPGERLGYVPVFGALLKEKPNIGGFLIAYENGDFFAFRHITLAEERASFNAPAAAVFLAAYIDHAPSSRRTGFIYYDEALEVISERAPAPELDFDPRTRPWYLEAMQSEELVESHPFLMPTTRQPVVTFSQKVGDGKAVMAVDMLLEEISSVLHRLLPTPNSRLGLYQPDGDLLGAAHGVTIMEADGNARIRTISDISPIARMGLTAYLEGARGRGLEMYDGEQWWEVSIEEFDRISETQNAMLLAIPRSDLLAGSREFLRYACIGMIGILLFTFPVMWFAAKRIAAPLKDLAKRTQSFRGFADGGDPDMNLHIAEFYELAKGITQQQKRLRQSMAIFSLIGSKRDTETLTEQVLCEVKDVSGMDDGVILLSDGSGDFLLSGISCGKNSESETVQIASPDNRDPGLANALAQAAARTAAFQYSLVRDECRFPGAVLAAGFSDPEVLRIDRICVGIRRRTGELQGVLMLDRSAGSRDRGLSPAHVAFIENLAASVGIVLETQALIKTHRDLLDGLIKIMADAIDAKSPYTGNHCKRVPILFEMLLHAACDATEGPLAGFSLNENEWEEAKLAGWLHDCGKVTTPEYVMDKATKLETIYDRIHEIRTRFEVLKRDAEIAGLRAILDGADPEEERRGIEEAFRVLDDEFAFVASCNIGDEAMDENRLRRLEEIGRRAWTRTLDKRLGVSRDERARMDAVGVSETPARERLLMDTPEHIIPRGEKDTMPADNPWGFKDVPPDALYNRGELYNLSVKAGTLTMEERYKINDHIRRTIIMLESVPWPNILRNMPEIAGAHHETMDGKGYPRKLRAQDMSLSARMMAIADIFEALTAWDRPYKSSKTLRQTLKIMEDFKNRQHIDPDLFKLFIKADIPRRYAAEYLKPEQNDL